MDGLVAVGTVTSVPPVSLISDLEKLSDFDVAASTMALLEDPPQNSIHWTVTSLDREMMRDAITRSSSEQA